MKRTQAGASLLIVLVMLTVLLFAAVSLARVNQSSSQLAGNLSYKASAMQASEAGLSEAFAQLQALPTASLDANQGSWYYSAVLDLDGHGLPQGVNWAVVPKVDIRGGYSVSYVVERLCTVTPVTDVSAQCFLRRLPAGGSAKAGTEQLESPAVVQFRITAFVRGPKGTQTTVQAMANRSS